MGCEWRVTHIWSQPQVDTQELQFLALLHGLHFTALVVATWFIQSGETTTLSYNTVTLFYEF